MRLRAGIFIEAGIIALLVPSGIAVNRALGPMYRGQLAAVLLMPTVVGPLVCCQWERILKLRISAGIESEASIVSRTARYAAWMISLGIVAAVGLVFTEHGIATGMRLTAIAFAALYIPIWIAFNLSINIHVGSGRVRCAYSARIAQPVVYAASIVVLYLRRTLTVEAVLIANAASYAAAGAISVTVLMARGAAKPCQCENPESFLHHVQKNAVPFAVETVCRNSDIWLLSNFVGAEATGAYAACRVIGLPFNAAAQALINVGTSRYNWKVAGEAAMITRRFVATLLAIALLASSILAFIAHSLVAHVLGAAYARWAWLLPIVAISEGLYYCSFVLNNSVLLTGKQRAYRSLQLYPAAFQMAIASIGCIVFGLEGMCAAYIAGGLVRTAIPLWVLKRAESTQATDGRMSETGSTTAPTFAHE